ncbi:MAG: hypothetical protein D6819_09275 [Gammaproteobacteria bacterium]|nr:MAG: hypothetical protein D6819_09275 [Gammaproteobacteria bacterium]
MGKEMEETIMKRILLATTVAMTSFFAASSGANIPWQYGSHQNVASNFFYNAQPLPTWPAYNARPMVKRDVRHKSSRYQKSGTCLASWDDHKLLVC